MAPMGQMLGGGVRPFYGRRCFKDTHTDTWRHDDLGEYVDRQSDGKASPGLTGEHVGAYIKSHEDGRITR